MNSVVAKREESKESLIIFLEQVWQKLVSNTAESELFRVRRYMDIMSGKSHYVDNSQYRALFKNLYFPGLSKGPFYDYKLFDIDLLEECFFDIETEILQGFRRSQHIQNHSDLLTTGNWLCIYLKRDFEWLAECETLYPRTSIFLRSQRVATEALFSRLMPGAKIDEHSDFANYVSTIHIPTRADNSSISVAKINKRYKYKIPICFDSSFMHEVENHSTIPRDILLYNVWHPDLTDIEVWAISLIRDCWPSELIFDVGV